MKKILTIILSLTVVAVFSNVLTAAPKMKEDFEKKELGKDGKWKATRQFHRTKRMQAKAP